MVALGGAIMGGRVKGSAVPSTDHEPLTGQLAHKYALSLLTLKREGSTMAMLSARGVEVDKLDELIAAGLATATTERVDRRKIEITRVKITEAGIRALFQLQYLGPSASVLGPRR
jgi:hypothetical protein